MAEPGAKAKANVVLGRFGDVDQLCTEVRSGGNPLIQHGISQGCRFGNAVRRGESARCANFDLAIAEDKGVKFAGVGITSPLEGD